MEKTSVSVKIYNDNYILRTEASEEDVRAVAQMVDEKMQLLAEKKQHQNTEKIAVWAALDLAAELYKLRRDCARLLKIAKER